MPLHHMNYIQLNLLAFMLKCFVRLHVVLTELYIAHIVCVVDFAGKKPLQK